MLPLLRPLVSDVDWVPVAMKVFLRVVIRVLDYETKDNNITPTHITIAHWFNILYAETRLSVGMTE